MKGQQAIGTLVIFIALVITAALASFVLVSTTNALQSKSLAVAEKTMEKSTTAFAARQVEGIAKDDGKIQYIMFAVELAPGSPTIDLDDTKVIWTANGGKEYAEYELNRDDTNNPWIIDLNAYNLVFVKDDNAAVEVTLYADTNNGYRFYVVENRSDYADGDQPDRFLESGEVYTLAFKLEKTLDEGEDWQIIVRAPYSQDLRVTGYAPEVIQQNTIVTLKSG